MVTLSLRYERKIETYGKIRRRAACAQRMADMQNCMTRRSVRRRACLSLRQCASSIHGRVTTYSIARRISLLKAAWLIVNCNVSNSLTLDSAVRRTDYPSLRVPAFIAQGRLADDNATYGLPDPRLRSGTHRLSAFVPLFDPTRNPCEVETYDGALGVRSGKISTCLPTVSSHDVASLSPSNEGCGRGTHLVYGTRMDDLGIEHARAIPICVGGIAAKMGV